MKHLRTNAYVARVRFSSNTQAGKIKREKVCSKCGSLKNIDAHHCDYNKPLEVQWLCRTCHREWHRHRTAEHIYFGIFVPPTEENLARKKDAEELKERLRLPKLTLF